MSTVPGRRLDIDGLRAVAVVLVVLFHALPEVSGLSGGFLGVDVFFVISGFLITSILIRENRNGTFSFISFYARRFRRILPALVVMLLGVMALGQWLLIPEEGINLSRHLAAGATFVSNMLLWREAGYFDVSSSLKPLLHLWSLSIEEQYYLIWPFIILAAHRLNRSLIATTLLVVLTSFGAFLYVHHHDPTSAFYFMPTRLWELAIGALLSALSEGPLLRLGKWGAHISSLLGGAMLAAGPVLVAEQHSDLSLVAPLVTVGAAFLIAAGPTGVLNRTVLSSRVAAYVGLISYPLYLWHWPLLSFAKIVEQQTVALPVRAGLVFASFVLAALTYQFVERPLRHIGEAALGADLATVRRSHKRVVFRSIIVLVGLAGGAFGFHALEKSRVKGQSRLEADLQQHGRDHDMIGTLKRVQPASGRRFDSLVGIIGDSHIEAFAPLNDTSYPYVYVWNGGRLPLSGIFYKDEQPRDDRDNNAVLFGEGFDYLLGRSDVKALALFAHQGSIAGLLSIKGQHYPWCFRRLDAKACEADPAKRGELFFEGLKNSVDRIAQAKKVPIVVIDWPDFPFHPSKCLEARPVRLSLERTCDVPLADIKEHHKAYQAGMARFRAEHPEVRFFDTTPVLCPGTVCSPRRGDRMLYSDPHHLSDYGGELVFAAFNSWLAKEAILPAEQLQR